MGFIKKFLGLLILLSVAVVALSLFTTLEKLPAPLRKLRTFTLFQYYPPNVEKINIKILTYQKPARVEILNYVKNPDHIFQKDIEEVKKMKVPLNKDAKFYIKIQFFVDETDPTAPLMAQFFFLETRNDNLIKEDTLRLDLPSEK